MQELEQLRIEGQKHGIEKISHANSAAPDSNQNNNKNFYSLNISMKGKAPPTKINTRDPATTNAEYS